MNLSKIRFPLYKLRAYLSMDTNLLGVTKITTVKGVYIFDDTSIPGNFEERRLKLSSYHPRTSIYKLKERVMYLRQLVKYKTGTTFVDITGKLIKYKKSSKLFNVKSYIINRKKEYGNWTIIYVNTIEHPYIIGHVLQPTTTHASIMHSSWGLFLYDLTNEYHKSYKRKI